MKDRVLQNISNIIVALNSISVSGKANLANLSGSIAALEDLYKALSGCVFTSDLGARNKNEKE